MPRHARSKAEFADPFADFPITTEMRALKAAAAQPRSGPPLRTIIMTAFLRFSGNPHRRGSFVSQGRKDPSSLLGSMHMLADQLVASSPTMCSPGVSIHIVHDLTNHTHHRLNVTYHGSARAPWRPPDAQRFVLYAELLRRITWDCAFAVDISDVVMLRVPPCHALPKRLIIGSDSDAGWFRGWLRKAARLNGLLGNLSESFAAFLNGSKTRDLPGLNVGVLGGCRATLQPLLQRVVRKFEMHWPATGQRALSAASDMVLWNQLGDLLHDASTPPLTGFPTGPVNMPMYGGVTPGKCLARYVRNGTQRIPNPCRQRWLQSTRGMYWFAHKPVASWIVSYMDPASFKYLRRVRFTGRPRSEDKAPMCTVGADGFTEIDWRTSRCICLFSWCKGSRFKGPCPEGVKRGAS